MHPAFALMLSLLLTIGVDAAPPSVRPNILFVLIDDMGYSDLSCYGGQPGITPNIDSLAKEGLRFSQFYVGAPICSPSRTAFTTGQEPARWRITSYLASRKENKRRHMADWLDPQAPTVARALKAAGYATGHFGKWHMGGQRDVGEAPLITEYGFDESLTQFEGLGDRILPLLNPFDGSEPKKYALGSDELGRGNIQWMDRSKATSAFVARSIEFMKKAQRDGKPFYVNLWPDDVHSPFFPPKALRGDGSKRELYLGVLKAMDAQFEPIFSYIKESPSLRTNTLIVVASDNGPEPGAGLAGPFRGNKGLLYEGGFREPLIVWGPGLVNKRVAGTINSKTVVWAPDFLPSILSVAGVKSSKAAEKSDGQDLSRSLLGRARQVRSKPLFWNRPPDRPGPESEPWPDLAMRDGDWKLLMMEDGSGVQLYKLSKDPGETNNLAIRHPDVVRRMSTRLAAWWKSMPVPRYAESRPKTIGPEALNYFANPLAEGADPWVVRHGTNYITVQSEGNRGIALYRSDRLTEFGEKHVVWNAPESGPCSREIWAPEIHWLDGNWYVYMAGSDGQNKNHKMWALRSVGSDPLGKYELKGPLYTGDNPETGEDNRWAIDGTPFERNGKRYFVWSGWQDTRDVQWLYAAEMKDPLTLGKRVRLCNNDDYVWERVSENQERRGLHEAPQYLEHGGRAFIVYSCSSSWQPSYKLGLLELKQGGDPLNPNDWKKHPEPVFSATYNTYGIGHNCFVKSPDGKQDWLVFHAKMDRRDGWRRAIYAQPFGWTAEGFPQFGAPAESCGMLPLPSGEVAHPLSAPWKSELSSTADLEQLNYFGHHQFIALKDGRLHLGIRPAEPINDYRCGEKVLIAGRYWRDLDCSVTLRAEQGGRDAGLLFRCTLPSVGYDSQHGYFAGIIPQAGKVVLGSTDCESWREIALVDADVRPGRDHLLSVTAVGPEIVVRVDGKEVIRAKDSQHVGGSVGLRVLDSHYSFSNLTVN